MKIYRIAYFALVLFFNVSCSAQLVKTISDVPKIKEHDQNFVNKTLGTLLKEMAPDIKLFFAEPGSSEQGGYITFLFIDYNQYKELGLKNKEKTRLTVYLKGKFESNNYELPIEKRFVWTKEYKEKYSDLIVLRIKVSGNG